MLDGSGDPVAEVPVTDRSATYGAVTGADGVTRCPWPGDHADYHTYHDDEWGRPVVDDVRLFEKACLEGFQAGLSWLTILRKRDNFRAAFAGFNPAVVAHFTDVDVARCLGDAGIVRHRGKIESTINNAARALEIIDQFGSLAAYIWIFEPDSPVRATQDDIPATTAESTALSHDLKHRGWSFVGPTTIYALMQAMGMVNDHLPGCDLHAVVAAERTALVRPVPHVDPATTS
ncbi:MAG: DNA-3-methyladenine glycosylase I [Acidimicrobiales bacterium]|nr:DNA-3-methyladenine glycosylase I [Acidimicrobiales bacterium]